ncbi:TPA: hypothetical protein N0F65_000748 [Lagenidium giganteum]|uniref:EF-hand domain-containing protein n=1 Tax=Lagenidium giganteum TaxID=4803 RepID=A0AAV2ZQQ7_9STRA|nr:TPA: hypothetical protein N0F65_000748 [Lagenidium giganteum]
MGQLHGKAVYIKAATPFVNASEKDVNKLWEAFNDVAEGFGLTQDEMAEICRALQPTLEIHAKADMDALTAVLFNALDTDENGLVDALEFLGTIAVMSAMTIAQKLTFVYNCYDFNESSQISLDELTLALRSTLTGLCKLSVGMICPTEIVLEDMALHAFHRANKTQPDDYLTLPEFLLFAETTPELTSWIDYFDAADEAIEEHDRDDSDLEQESAVAVVPLDDPASVCQARQRDPSKPFDRRAPQFTPDAPVALRPWQNAVANATPSAPPTINPSSPAASLDLEWIYGFNSDVRNVLHYVSPAEIVFPAGNVAVLYDVIEHKQRFAAFHTDVVQTVAVHPINRNIVATGERGATPKIVVWHAQQLGASLSVVRGFHRNGVAHLAWMPHGRALVAVGQDEFHCVAVYQWTKALETGAVEWTHAPTIVFAGRCGREPVHALTVQTGDQFVTAGRRHLRFWSRENDARYTSAHVLFHGRRGVLGRKTKVQTLLSLATLPADSNMVLAGSARGHILVFEGRNCIKVIHAHATAVNVLHAFVGGVLSGGKDGKIRLWSKRMEPGAQFDMEALGSMSSRVRSVVASPDGGAKLLVGTSGAEMYELATSDGSNLHFGAMLCGHCAFELHGMAVHPLKREFCTAGDDRTVRVWDMTTHRQLRMAVLDAPARTCAYSPDGALIAVGEGAPDEGVPTARAHKLLNVNKQGAFAVLSESTLALKYEGKDSKKYIRTIRFSGDGLTLAVGSNDSYIYAYNTEDWASKGKCKARDAAAVLSQFDFSTSGEYIMANASNKGEMVFFEAGSGVEITRIATLKDVEWLTCTCPFGWGVQGVWPSTQANAYEVTALDRSGGAVGHTLLAVGDGLGVLRLFRYPCVAPNALCQVFRAASSAISCVRFSSDNSIVLSTGRDERCVFQWRVEYEEEDGADGGSGPQEYEYHANSDDELEMSHGVERSPLDEATSAGDYALELLYQRQLEAACGGTATPAAVMPVRPWVASCIAPADGPDEKDLELSTVPNDNLELEWIHGYRCHDARNNVFLTRDKAQLVYPAATFVVVLDTKLWLQKHFKHHTDEVTSLAVHFGVRKKKRSADAANTSATPASPSKTAGVTASLGAASTNNLWEVAASGQMGKFPVIHVWRLDTLEVLTSLRGFHRQGIAELCFNSAGNLLASVGLDDRNSLAIYDWQNGVLLAHASASGIGRIMGVAFQQETKPADAGTASATTSTTAPAAASSATSVLMTVGVKSLTFWRLTGQNLVKKNALLGKKGLIQTFLSVVYCGKDAIVGATSGDLYRFKGIEVATVMPAHVRGVAALYCVPTTPHHIVSGGKDGLVKLWSSDLECLGEFGEFNGPKHPIRSAFWDYDRNTLVIGTRGASIHQLSSIDGSVVAPKTPDGIEVPALDGHWKRELRGLSVCATKDRFCTTGDDAMLRVWDLQRRVLILARELDTASRACAYSYDGDFIAVGLGGGSTGKRHKKDGSLLVMEDRGQSIELVYETRDTKQSITVIKYSPDGQSLVVGSMDNSVYIYDVPNNYAKRAVFSKHKSWITHLDISSDSQYVRSNCGGYELMFADITTGSHVASATALRNQKWETCSTIYNWSNQGIWPVMPSAAAIQITSCAASVPGTSKDIDKAVLVAGTAHGALQMFKFPAFVRGAGSKSYPCHAGPVAELMFSGHGGGARCVSIGRTDRCVLQWRRTRARPSQDDMGGDVGNTLVLKDPEEDEDLVEEGMFMPESFLNVTPPEVKPYLSAIVPPSAEVHEPSEHDGVTQRVQFDLEHVFGFRAYDVRSNVVYSKTKHVVFHTGCLGVHYDRRTHTQQFYRGHSRPIVSLAASQDGSFVATGEICSANFEQERPRIHIWEPAACAPVAVLSEFHTKAVGYLAFGQQNRLLASVGQDEYHSLAVYSSASGLWFDGALLATTRTTRQPVYFVTFVEDASYNYHLVSGGKDHVLFWKLDSPNLVATFGVFGAKAQQQPILCGQSIDNIVVTGTSTGHLYVWEACAVTRAIPAHQGAVYALHATTNGCVSGGRDGHIKVWSRSLAPLGDFDVSEVKPASQNPIVRSLCWDTAEDRVLIGTRGGEVLELSRLTGEASLVTESHYDHGELYGLSSHPQRPELVATAGEDQTVRVWDLVKRQVQAKVTLDGPLRSVEYSPDGKWLAAGFGCGSRRRDPNAGGKDGAFVVLDATTLEVLHEGRDSKQPITDIKFSPDLTLLALGSCDHAVYLYSTLDNFSLRFKFVKSTGKVLRLDFAKDSSALRVNSDAFELLYMSTLDGAQITTPSSMKDVEWATHTCVFAWAVQGIWDYSKVDEYYHCTSKPRGLDMVVAGNNKGEIRVYNAPCLSKNTEQRVLRGHSMNISNVVFACDDSRMISIGRTDKTLLVWTLAPVAAKPT